MYSQHVADALHNQNLIDTRHQKEKENAPILAILSNPEEDAYHSKYYKWQHNYKLRYHPVHYRNDYNFGILYHRQPKNNARWGNPNDLVNWVFKQQNSKGEYDEPQEVRLYVENDARVVYMQKITDGQFFGKIKPIINRRGEEARYSSFNRFCQDMMWVENREQAKLAAKAKAREEAKKTMANFSAVSVSVVDTTSNVHLARPLRTDYSVKPTGFFSDMKKEWKKAVKEGKKMYKEGKEMYKEYKKYKKAQTSEN